jgi:hypothetical protein
MLLIVLGFLGMMSLSAIVQFAGSLADTQEALFAIALFASMIAFILGVLSTFGSLCLRLLITSPDFAAMTVRAVRMSCLFDLLIWKEVRDEARRRAQAKRF